MKKQLICILLTLCMTTLSIEASDYILSHDDGNVPVFLDHGDDGPRYVCSIY